MSSLNQDTHGNWRIQYYDPGNTRRTFRIGKVSKQQARSVQAHLDELVSAQLSQTQPSRHTLQWTQGLSERLYSRLIALKLIQAKHRRDSVRISEWVEKYATDRTDVSDASRTCYRQVKANLVDKFGDVGLETISQYDAEQFRIWLHGSYATATANRRTKYAKQLFEAARKADLIEANPFRDVKGGQSINDERKRFISRSDAHRVLEMLPDSQWRLIVALSRYGGLRVPSEVLSLTWGDVLWDQMRLVVHDQKRTTTRIVPIFPELEPYLKQRWDDSYEGDVQLITRYRQGSNLGTQFKRYVEKAGLTPWPRLFHNMRASRQTELTETFPAHVVSAWMGNSTKVAEQHYLQVTDDHFAQATPQATLHNVELGRIEQQTEKSSGP